MVVDMLLGWLASHTERFDLVKFVCESDWWANVVLGNETVLNVPFLSILSKHNQQRKQSPCLALRFNLQDNIGLSHGNINIDFKNKGVLRVSSPL